MNNTYDNEMKIEFLSKSNNEAFARITVAAFAAQLDPTIEEISDIKTAVSEAVTNSIIHGYENKEGIIKVLLRTILIPIIAELVLLSLIAITRVPLGVYTPILVIIVYLAGIVFVTKKNEE